MLGNRTSPVCPFFAQVLEDLCTLMAEWNLYNVITNPSGSHVARKLLCVVTGRDVSPTSGRDAGKNKVRCAQS